jgi:hypothetical protein
VEQLDNCTRKCSFKCKRTGSPDPFHPWLQITATIDKIESWSWNDMLQEHTVATTASSLHLSPSGINVTERRSRIAFASRQKQLLRVPAKNNAEGNYQPPKQCVLDTAVCIDMRYGSITHMNTSNSAAACDRILQQIEDVSVATFSLEEGQSPCSLPTYKCCPTAFLRSFFAICNTQQPQRDSSANKPSTSPGRLLLPETICRTIQPLPCRHASL